MALKLLIDGDLECSYCKLVKPITEFHKCSTHTRGFAYYCKQCANLKSKTWHKNNKNNPEVKRAKRDSWLRSTWNLSTEEYSQKLINQDSKCAICKIELLPYGTFTHLDHDHESLKIRDFLCNNCNRGLGHFKDNVSILIAASQYLERHKNVS